MDEEIDVLDFANYMEECILKDEEILKPYWDEIEKKESNFQNSYIPKTPKQRVALKELQAIYSIQNDLKENSLEDIRKNCYEKLESSDMDVRSISQEKVKVINGYLQYSHHQCNSIQGSANFKK